MKVQRINCELNNSRTRLSNQNTILVFISYSTKDSERFKVPHIAERLIKYPEIERVLYWEEHMCDDIIKYMNDNVGKCDVLLIFCSPNSLKSEPVEMEWQAALKIKKKIIPIFSNERDIPTMLATKLGIKFNKNDIDVTIEQIYKLILKKIARY